MSIFNLHATVLDDYGDFVRSFFSVADDRAREFIERTLVAEEALWPEPMVQVSPSYARTASVDELAERGVILRETAQIFRTERGASVEFLELSERPADAPTAGATVSPLSAPSRGSRVSVCGQNQPVICG